MLNLLAGTTEAIRYIALGIAIFYPLSIVISLLVARRSKPQRVDLKGQRAETPHYRCWSETGARGIVSDLPE